MNDNSNSPYRADTFGEALMLSALMLVVVAALAATIIGLVALLIHAPLIATIILTAVLLLVGGAFLVQRLDAKHGWFDLGGGW